MSQRIWVGAGLFLLMILAAGIWLHRHLTRYDEILEQTADRYDLDVDLVKALVFEESWFRAEARGASGEVGLMQITMAAAQDFAAKKGFPPLHEARLLEPRLNVEIGCWYLRESLDRYRNSPAPTLFALFRYNAGETRADNWLRTALSTRVPQGSSDEEHFLSVVDFPTTRQYAQHIMQRYRSRNFWF